MDTVSRHYITFLAQESLAACCTLQKQRSPDCPSAPADGGALVALGTEACRHTVPPCLLCRSTSPARPRLRCTGPGVLSCLTLKNVESGLAHAPISINRNAMVGSKTSLALTRELWSVRVATVRGHEAAGGRQPCLCFNPIGWQPDLQCSRPVSLRVDQPTLGQLP